MVLFVFIVIWLLVMLVNMWVGVSKVGYVVWEELLILLLVFVVLVLLVGLLYWCLVC